ncbi:MAG TPA: glycogen synthase GlgA, partial [Pirellulales bacterium]|nr:glycogen synthase GlgA [Pirellulales bacterium]
EALAAGKATGFSFREYSPLALAETVGRACDAYGQKSVWSSLVRGGMNQDWSWNRSAQQYVALYQKISRK